MKSPQADNIASVVLKYLLHLLSIAAVYGILLYTTSQFWIHHLLNWFTRVPYVTAPNFHDHVIHQLIIYSMFCYFANNFILDLYHTTKAKQLIISIIVDVLIMPLSILIMIIYNNIAHKNQPGDINTIYNIYLVTVLLVIKEYIAMKILARNNPKGSVKKVVR
ncbi:MAG TPA: hypothetical protein VK668_07880 [Mucilaginibacter sp.]|nr:hypothetical protein [Mucilaginibacter sp.]